MRRKALHVCRARLAFVWLPVDLVLPMLITGIADAMIDSTPIVVIAGQVRGQNFLGTDAFQEVDLVGITQPITKWSYQIRRAEDVAWAVARAFYVAKSGRPGPVVLDFAKNAQVEKTEYAPTKVDYVRSYLPVCNGAGGHPEGC